MKRKSKLATAMPPSPPFAGSPHRVQLSRKRGWRMPPNTVSVARPHRFGNPHRIGWCNICGASHTRQDAIAELSAELDSMPGLRDAVRENLKGKNLACWCKLSESCHADLLLQVANKGVTGVTTAGRNVQ